MTVIGKRSALDPGIVPDGGQGRIGPPLWLIIVSIAVLTIWPTLTAFAFVCGFWLGGACGYLRVFSQVRTILGQRASDTMWEIFTGKRKRGQAI